MPFGGILNPVLDFTFGKPKQGNFKPEMYEVQQSQYAPQQQNLIDLLQAQSQGQGPAQQLLKQQHAQRLEQAQNAAASQAAGARGISPGLAATLAARQQGQMAAQANQVSSQDALRQQLAAQQQLLNAIRGARQQDISVEGISAGQQQAANQMLMQQALANQGSRNQRQNALLGGLIQGGATGLMMSDETAKEDIEESKGADVDDFLDKLQSATYKYKQEHLGKPGTAPGKRFGVMAQSIAESIMGKSFVEKGGDGLLRVDTNQGFGALLAAQKRLHERMKALEGAAAAQ